MAIGSQTMAAVAITGTVELGVGSADIGDVTLLAGTAAVGTVGLDAGVNDIGDVGVKGRAGTTPNEPAADTAAVVTIAGVGAQRHNLVGVYWSYDADPTAGSLTVTDAGAPVLKVDITKGGPGFLPFSTPIRSAAVNTDLVATLAAGGGGISGIVSVHAWTEA